MRNGSREVTPLDMTRGKYHITLSVYICIDPARIRLVGNCPVVPCFLYAFIPFSHFCVVTSLRCYAVTLLSLLCFHVAPLLRC